MPELLIDSPEPQRAKTDIEGDEIDSNSEPSDDPTTVTSMLIEGVLGTVGNIALRARRAFERIMHAGQSH